MTPEELERFELEVSRAPSLETEMRRAEDALIADYLDKNLSAEEESLFFENFLVSRQRFDSVRRIRHSRSMPSEQSSENSAKVAREGNFVGGLMYLLALDRRPSLFVLGVLLVIFGSILVWQIGRNSSKINNRSLHSMLSAQTALDLSNLHNFESYSSLALYSDGRQMEKVGARFSAGGLSKEILLRLALPPEATSEKCFSLEIAVDNGEKISLNKLKAYSNEAGSEIRLLVPREMAEKRDCQITLTGKGLKKPQVKYHLRLD